MKYLITPIILSICFFLIECGENDTGPQLAITAFTPSSASAGEMVTISGTGFSNYASPNIRFNDADAIVNSVTTSQIVTTVPASASTGKISLTINGVTVESADDFIVTDTWKVTGDFRGEFFVNDVYSMGTGFSVNGKGYIGGFGFRLQGTLTEIRDFWEYDPLNNAWTQKADFPGEERKSAVTFAIGNKGYIGMGENSNGKLKDFWEYDPATDRWTRREDFGGEARSSAVGFGIGSKGYVGTGEAIISNAVLFMNDFWEYDQDTGHWLQKADFAGGYKGNAFGLSIESKGYIGGGHNYIPSASNAFYEYNPATDEWKQKANCSDFSIGVSAFSIKSKAFVCNGSQLHEYDPGADEWTRRADCPANVGITFSIGGYGYAGLGWNDTDFLGVKTFYQYTPNNR
jgi:hypothetical protein